MKSPYLLHIFTPGANASPFDVNMAYEAGYDGVIPYSGIALADIHAFTQDTIFSRSPEGIKKTSIFIGGRAFIPAIDMLNRARSAMVPPFAVSVFADPSGAITTSAAIVACIKSCLGRDAKETLEGKDIYIIGGTGPVGSCAAVIASHCGANVFIVSYRGYATAQRSADELNNKFNANTQGYDGSSGKLFNVMLQHADIIINTAKAGVQVLSKEQLQQSGKLAIVADANAVPPLGIEGVGSKDMGRTVEGTANQVSGIGALAIGDLKYKIHCRLLQMMKESEEPVFLDHEKVFEVACQYIQE